MAGAEQGPASTDAAGVIDFYRSIAAGSADLSRRYRAGLVAAVGLIAMYALLRTIDADRTLLLAWAAATAVLAVVSPAHGLIVLAAIAPFSEPLTFTRQLGLKPILVLALAVGVALRVAAEVIRARRISWPPAPLLFAALIGAGTLASVLVSYMNFGRPFAVVAVQVWLAGIGGGLLILGVAYWTGRQGTLWPAAAAVASGTVGGYLSLMDWLQADLLRGSILDWTLRPNRFDLRLTGIIPSPNGVASLVIVPAAVLIAGAALGPSRRFRLACTIAVLPLLATLYFRFSRAALIGLFLMVVIVTFRRYRRAGIALLAAGIIIGAAFLPTYLQARNQAVGGEGNVSPGALLVASDALRVQAWKSASAMWLDAPITGHGFQSYRELHGRYGDPMLSAPHNEWIRLFAEEGVFIGLAGLAFAVTTLLHLGRGPGWLGAGVLAAFAGWCVAASFNNPTGYIQVGVIVFTVAGTGLALALRPTPNSAATGPPPARP